MTVRHCQISKMHNLSFWLNPLEHVTRFEALRLDAQILDILSANEDQSQQLVTIQLIFWTLLSAREGWNLSQLEQNLWT